MQCFTSLQPRGGGGSNWCVDQFISTERSEHRPGQPRTKYSCLYAWGKELYKIGIYCRTCKTSLRRIFHLFFFPQAQATKRLEHPPMQLVYTFISYLPTYHPSSPRDPKKRGFIGDNSSSSPPFTLNTEARSISMGGKECTFPFPFPLLSFTSLDETNLLFLSSFSQVIISCSLHSEPLGSSSF